MRINLFFDACSVARVVVQSFYGSAHADNSRWPWLDNHMIFNVLGGNNGYEVILLHKNNIFDPYLFSLPPLRRGPPVRHFVYLWLTLRRSRWHPRSSRKQMQQSTMGTLNSTVLITKSRLMIYLGTWTTLISTVAGPGCGRVICVGRY
jgi:hypothetical protein